VDTVRFKAFDRLRTQVVCLSCGGIVLLTEKQVHINHHTFISELVMLVHRIVGDVTVVEENREDILNRFIDGLEAKRTGG
jgi:hypothetical protein